MKRLLFLFALMWATPSHAQWNGCRAGLCAPEIVSSGVCSEATTFLARTSGLNGTETAAYTAMICGMVADGVWSKLDALYIFATNTTTTANLNLINTSYTLSQVGSGGALTFTADQGYTGVFGSALDTGLVLTSATKYTLNSGGFGGYILNNRTAGDPAILGGVSNIQVTYLRTNSASNNSEFDVNSSTFSTVSATTAQGSWFNNRSAASGAGALTLYRNGISVSATTTATVSVPAVEPVYINALNNSGTVNSSGTDQISAFWIGGGFTGTDVANFSSRVNAYMTALGINVY